MKKTLLIIGGIGLVVLLLVGRLFYKQNNTFTEEREWFVKSLGYEFSAKVDSITMLNQSTGRLLCNLTMGDPQVHREDSLKSYFKEHDMLYFIFRKSGDSITFLLPYANRVSKGDSIVVSSKTNSISIFSKEEKVVNEQLTKTLTGYGRPFFMKRKNQDFD